MKVWNWENEEKNLKRYFIEEKRTFDEVLNIYEVCPGTLRKVCKHLKINYLPQKKIILTDFQKEEFKKLCLSGETKEKIKKKFNLTDTSFWNYRQSLGLSKKKNLPWKDKEIEELKIYIDEGKSYKEIEKLFLGRRSLEGIMSHVKKLGLTYKGSTRHKFTKEEEREIIKLTKEGETVPSIAKFFGVKEGGARNVLRRNKINSISDKDKILLGKPTKCLFKPKIELTKENIIDILKANNYNRKDTAKTFGVSVDTIRRRIKTFNITIPVLTKIRKESKVHPLILEILGKRPSKTPRIQDVVPKDFLEIRLKKHNFNIRKTAESLKISYSQCQKLIKFNNIKIIRPRLSNLSDDYLKELYITKDLNPAEISEIVGLSSDTLRKYLKKRFPEKSCYGKYSSQGEVIISKALKKIGINNFEYNKRYKGYNKEIPERLYIIDFEFKFNNKIYWIEFNGKQHYEFVKYFYKTEDRFKNMRERDNFVSKILTKEVGAELIVIRYDECHTEKEAIEIIKNKLKIGIAI